MLQTQAKLGRPDHFEWPCANFLVRQASDGSLRNSSGNLAILAAIRRASSRVIKCAADRRPARQSCEAVSTTLCRIGCSSNLDRLIVPRISAVALCRSSASCNSRLSWTTSVSAPGRNERLPLAFGLRLFDFGDLERRDLAGSPLALVWRLIASPVQVGIVAGRGSTLEVVYWRLAFCWVEPNSSNSALASFRSRVSNPSVNQP
jgi:hypothetical protein